MLFSGMHIPKQECDYFKTEDGIPAIMARWEGPFFGHRQQAFVFARDALAVARLSDDFARLQARLSGFSKWDAYGARLSLSGGPAAGIIGMLITGLVGVLTADTANIKGLAVIYLNDKQKQSNFHAVAAPETVDEILASIPAHKIRPDDDLEVTRL
jgi:hypothetical protein